MDKFDAQMMAEKRKVALIVDNHCPAHCPNENLRAVKVINLPPNTTSELQPLDQGIISNLKFYYRREAVKYRIDYNIHKYLHSLDTALKFNVLQAIQFLSSAWKEVTLKLS